MAAITKTSVLNKLIEETINQQELSHDNVYNKGWFGEIYQNSKRKTDLDDVITQLVTEEILVVHKPPPVYKWIIKDIGEAVAERDRLVEEDKKHKSTVIGTYNHVGVNYGVNQQSGQGSRLEYRSEAAPVSIPINTGNTIRRKTFWSKALLFIWDNTWKIVITVVAGYILFKMGWKK